MEDSELDINNIFGKKDYKTVDEDINSLNSNIAKKNEKCTVGCISKGFETRKQVTRLL